MLGKKPILVLAIAGCILLVVLFLRNREEESPYPAQTVHLPKANFLKIHLLGAEHVSPGTNTFHIGLEDWNFPILKTRILEDTHAEKIAALWRKLPFGVQYVSKCHDPAYALAFYSDADASPTLEASVCWQCNNFYFDIVGEKPCVFGFDGRSKEAQALLENLSAILPITEK